MSTEDGLAVNFRQVSHARADGADAMQQVQAVAPDDRVVGIDLNGGEEGVDGRAKLGHRGHRGGEIFGAHGGGDLRFGCVEGGKQGAFFVSLGEFRIGPVGVFDAVFGFRLAQDGVGAFEALQQVRAVFGFQEGRERLGAFDQ